MPYENQGVRTLEVIMQRYDAKFYRGTILAILLGYVSTMVIPGNIPELIKDVISPNLALWVSQFIIGYLLGYSYPHIWKWLAICTVSVLFFNVILSIVIDFAEYYPLWEIAIAFSAIAIIPAYIGSSFGQSLKLNRIKKMKPKASDSIEN